MAGFEDLIRGALIKQGNTTPESREKIYASARQALDRMVTENSSLDQSVVETQRTKLEDAISKIESDHSEATTTSVATEPEKEPVPEPEVETVEEPEQEVKLQEPDENEKTEPAAEATSSDDVSDTEPVVEPIPEDQPVPKIELSEPVTLPDTPPEFGAAAEEIDKPSPTEPSAKPESPKVESQPKAPEPVVEKPLPDESVDPAPVATIEEPDLKDEIVPKIKLSGPTEQPDIKETSPEPPTAEPDPKPFTLEAHKSSDDQKFEPEKTQTNNAPDVLSVVAPVAAAAAATATLDLSKGTRTAPDLIADPKPQPAAPTVASARVEPSIDTPRPIEAPVEQTTAENQEETPKPVRLQYEPEPPEIYLQSYSGNALKERRPYAKMLLWTIILAGLGVALWWAVTFAPALIKAQLDGSVPNPRATLESGSFVPGEGNEDGWITVFAPDANEDDVIPGRRSNMEVQRENGKQVMRMASPDGSPDNNLKIRIARSVMESLRGKAATFELMIRSTNSENQEFVLFCEFSKMGNCGRKRFSAGSNSEPFIFDVLVNDVALPANEDAYLSLNTDFSGKGRALDLYSVRVRTGA